MEVLFELLMFIVIVVGFLALAAGFLLVFFGTMIFMIDQQVLFCFSRSLFNYIEDSRFVGKLLLIIVAFIAFIVEILGVVCGFVVTIGIVLFNFAFDKEYHLEDCKKQLFGFEKYSDF